MKNFDFFSLSISGLILRFYLMMGIVIAAGFSGYWWLGILALPVFLSGMAGLRYLGQPNKINGAIRNMETTKPIMKGKVA